MISNAWQIDGQAVTMNLTIPPNATGLVYLPMLGTSSSNLTIQESGTTIWQNGAAAGSDSGVVFSHYEGNSPQNYAVWTVASGNYQFAWQVVLQAPRGLVATAANQQVSLFWNPAEGATGYNLKRSSTSGGPYTTLASNLGTLNYADLSVTNGETFYYVVSALSAGGESGNSLEASATPILNVNFGFETPSMGSGYEYNPSHASWTFSGSSPSGSGILGNGSAFGNPAAPQGVQAAFVQSTGTISQLLQGFSPGTTYTITFKAAQRSGSSQNGGESWNVMIDNTILASYNPGPSATTYVNYTASFTATSNAHTLSFVGTDLATGDNTVFIDNVSFVPPIPPVNPVVTLTSPTNNANYLAPAALSLTATIVTNSNFIKAVQFYANTNLIAQVTNAPYAYAWTNLGAGNYNLMAGVVFNGTNVADSAVVNVVVTNFTPVIQSSGLSSGNFFLTGTGQAAKPFVLLTSSNLLAPVVWIPLLTNISDSSGKFSFTNLPTTNTQQFYRVATP
jgi:hypothetical protein